MLRKALILTAAFGLLATALLLANNQGNNPSWGGRLVGAAKAAGRRAAGVAWAGKSSTPASAARPRRGCAGWRPRAR